MRIGVDGRELERGDQTGIGRYLVNFLLYGTRERPDDQFILYGNQTTDLNLVAPNLVVKKIPERITTWWDQVILPYHLKKDRIDVFFSSYIKAPLCAPCPFVTTVHDLLFLHLSEHACWRDKAYNAVFTVYGQVLSRKASAIITGSMHSKKDIMEILKIPHENIVVIPLGVPEGYHPVKDPETIHEVMERYGIHKPYVLSVGNFTPHKNLSRLVMAYARLEKEIRETYQLVLCGKGNGHSDNLKEAIRCLGAGPGILCTGFVQEQDLPALYSGAAVFAFPSLYEGFGMPVLEAMACGAPVITSHCTSLPEVIGDAGFLIDPTDIDEVKRALTILLTDLPLRNEFSRRGIERSKTFSAQKSSLQILELLEKVRGET